MEQNMIDAPLQVEAHGAFIDVARWLLELFGVYEASELVATLIMVILSTAISVSFFWVAKLILFGGVRRIVARTRSDWDDHLLCDRVLIRAAYLPSIFSMVAFGVAMHTDNWLNTLYMKAVYLYMTFSVGRFVLALVDSTFGLISTRYPKVQSLKSIKQLIAYVIFALIAIIMVGVVIDRNPATLIAGLGASAAIMSLVFKETIQSLVSGIQLSANNMVSVGDWIVVPKAGADGTVIEMNLNTVKIRNWNNTITTVPPSTLLADSFTNWKGMEMSQGRRITRSILVDMSSVRFISDDEAASFRSMPELYYYFQARQEGGEGMQDQLTNLTLYRQYLSAYILRDPQIQDPGTMTCMVRYLQPTQYGLPIELYCFTKTKVWVEHERIIAQLVDHMLASLPMFGLRAYQVASGATGREAIEGRGQTVAIRELAAAGGASAAPASGAEAGGGE